MSSLMILIALVVIPGRRQGSTSALHSPRYPIQWEILLPVCHSFLLQSRWMGSFLTLATDPGTQSGGNNWIGYLTTQYNNTLILAYSLAIAGATIDNSLATWGFGDMTSQIDAFQLYYASRPAHAPWTSDNTVASFWIGINE